MSLTTTTTTTIAIEQGLVPATGRVVSGARARNSWKLRSKIFLSRQVAYSAVASCARLDAPAPPHIYIYASMYYIYVLSRIPAHRHFYCDCPGGGCERAQAVRSEAAAAPGDAR